MSLGTMKRLTAVRHGTTVAMPHGALAVTTILLGCIAIANIGFIWANDGSYWPKYLCCAIITILAVGWFTFIPGRGCYAIIALSVADFLFGGIAFVPMLLLALLAVGFIGYSNLVEAALAGVALLGAIVFSPDTVAFPTIDNNLLSFPCLVALTLCVSTLIRRNGERQRQMQREQTLLANAGIAQNLHDYTTNDLSDIIMMAEYQLTLCAEDQREAWSNVRNMAVDALTHTRKAILTLEDDGDAIRQRDMREPREPHKSHEPHEPFRQYAENGLGELDDIIHTCRSSLAASGFTGDVMHLGTEPTTIDTDMASLVVGLMRELFGNIARHADVSGGYTMLIAWGDDSCSIDLSDKPKPNNAIGLRSGLERYRRTVEACHGQWNIEQSKNRWDFHATIPYRAAGRGSEKP